MRTSKQRQGLPQGAGHKRHIDVPSSNTQAMVKNCHHQKSLRCGQHKSSHRQEEGVLLHSTTGAETTHMRGKYSSISFTKALDDEIEETDVGHLVLCVCVGVCVCVCVSCGNSEIQICPF
jgi:hypothetical protein